MQSKKIILQVNIFQTTHGILFAAIVTKSGLNQGFDRFQDCSCHQGDQFQSGKTEIMN